MTEPLDFRDRPFEMPKHAYNLPDSDPGRIEIEDLVKLCLEDDAECHYPIWVSVERLEQNGAMAGKVLEAEGTRLAREAHVEFHEKKVFAFEKKIA